MPHSTTANTKEDPILAVIGRLSFVFAKREGELASVPGARYIFRSWQAPYPQAAKDRSRRSRRQRHNHPALAVRRRLQQAARPKPME
jgi:hypothetical protein